MNPESQVILVIDDDELLLPAIEKMLQRGGYSPIAVSRPLEALSEARTFPGEIHLLLTDIVMPEMDGFALARQVVAERRNIRVLLMTGYATRQSRLPLLLKPFQRDELLDKVRQVIDGPAPRAIDSD